MKGGIKQATIALFFVLIVTFFIINLLEEARLEVLFLDVGQGDAILVKSPFGQNILIDGGDGEKILTALSAELAPWDREIDLMILSHPHADHVKGLTLALSNYRVVKALHFGSIYDSPEYLAWLDKLEEEEVELLLARNKQRIVLGDACFLDIYAPPREYLALGLNNQSLVSRLDCENKSYLFAGDAEMELEEYLLRSGFVLKADVLKVAHHGSNTSTSLDFLTEVDPGIAVISAGVDNKFGHPHNLTLYRLKKRGVKIYRTDLSGSIGL